MKKDSLGDRMKKNYENISRIKLTRRTPVIMRLDGKAFHTLTKGCEKPFDNHLRDTMIETALHLCKNIQGAKCAYVQSDEISILLTDFDTLTTEAWFDYNIQKMVSISAAGASILFSKYYDKSGLGLFDSRVFNVPKDDVCNYFVWRQQDWIRNSLQMLARTHFSHKELHKKNSADIHEMLYTKNVNWADLESQWKNGNFLYKDGRDFVLVSDMLFTEQREAIDKYLYLDY